ncbi:HNH endonuclease [Tenacibaculum jejuense]|uniref:HNH endonuclease n=1 Tax=Tenacibaculum jejuense TaxID=584609 RepID=UPI0012FD20A1|nr:HNH endonuclease [Tenacibaculum jejuense]
MSFTIVYWIGVFTRQSYFNVLVDSINYCRKEKAMQLYYSILCLIDLPMGIEVALGANIKPKLKLTWHHLDDLDTDVKSSLELVHSVVHDQTFQHLGSFFQLEKLLTLVK